MVEILMRLCCVLDKVKVLWAQLRMCLKEEIEWLRLGIGVLSYRICVRLRFSIGLRKRLRMGLRFWKFVYG